MTTTGSAGDWPRVLFMGTPALAVPSLAALTERFQVVAVATQPDRRRGRGKKLAPSPVKQYAIEADQPVLQPRSLRDPRAVEELRRFEPDLIAVVAYGLLLPPEVLELPTLGCVNLHASLLPRHRGASPIQAAILAGDEVTGVTTMQMDEGLDTGPILMQRQVRLRPDDTAATLGARLSTAGAALLTRTVGELAAGALLPRPQNDAEATLTGLIRKEDGRVDWRQAADRIERRVRAMQPWPGAHTFHDDTRLAVWRAEVGSATCAEPGTVVEVGEALEVACGDGRRLRLLDLQRPGGKRMGAEAFLRGYTVAAGDRLGNPAPASA